MSRQLRLRSHAVVARADTPRALIFFYLPEISQPHLQFTTKVRIFSQGADSISFTLLQTKNKTKAKMLFLLCTSYQPRLATKIKLLRPLRNTN